MIRPEKYEDYKKISEMVENSFAYAEHSDGNEHILIQKLRKSDNYIPKLSLVYEENDTILGFIMFTKAKVGEDIVLALAPLAVDINNQNKGIGSKLVLKGHCIADNLGYNTIVVLGDYKYYNRFGYFPAKNIGIFPPFDVPNENFMVYQLSDKKIFNNTIEYAKEFFE